MAASAVGFSESRLGRFWTSTLGKKAIMAISGLTLFGFICGHLAGNLQFFEGAEKFNAYAALLKSLPGLLWGTRLTLLVMVCLHIWSSFQLWLLQRRARPVAYVKKQSVVSTYASRTMYMSGPIVLTFIIYHLLHFTFGSGGTPFHGEDVYRNVIDGFNVPVVAGFYVFAMALLCTHLYHGVWSMFQTLGIVHPRYTPVLRNLARVLAILIFLGFSSIPVSVLTGFVRL